jgi:heptose I phosphotransferase
MQEWEHLEWARMNGMPVPRAVASGEFVGPWGRLQSFLAVEELTGMLPLHEAVPAAERRLDQSTFHRWKTTLIDEMARITRELHRRRWFHKDLYFCHFYIAEEDTHRLPVWRGRVQLIDLHRLAYHPWTWRVWQAKDLAQLLYSSDVAGVTARDRLHFWHVYFGGDGPKWLQRWVRLKAARYWRHNEKRRATLRDAL